MFAIIETGGKQYRVAPDQKIIVEKLSGQNGDKITIEKVLMIESGQGEINFGNPLIDGAKVEAEIIKTFKNDKVIIFKKRRRKNSRRKQGHRQQQTFLKILSITN
jgi:large subunit ribosomal protein L21